MLSIGNINRWRIGESDKNQGDLINSPILFQLGNKDEDTMAFIDMFTYLFVGIWTGYVNMRPPFTDWFYRRLNPSDETWDIEH